MDVFIITTKEHYLSLPVEIRVDFKHVEFKEHNEYEKHKKDNVYMQLYKLKKKAKDELDKYLFDKRN